MYRKTISLLVVIFFGLSFFQNHKVVYAQGATPIERTVTATESLNADPTTGTVSMNIPIDVPAGRAGIQPSLSLLYNSSSANGLLGMGWVMEMGCIYRSTKNGVPHYDATDDFVLMQAGSRQELVDISGNKTEFRAKIEGAFMKFQFTNNAWLVTDKKGTKYYFGLSAATRVYDPNNTSRVFSWHLDKVEDTNGNYMTITYIRDGNDLYPDEIQYTGHSAASLSPFAKVKMAYATRLDIVEGYTTGFQIQKAKRLSSIDILVGTNRVRKYQFNYTQGAQTGRSLLSSVTQLGSDGTSSLPATTFTYSNGNADFIEPKYLAYFPDTHVMHGAARVIDFNKDGWVDIIHSMGGGTPYKIYLNTGSWNTNPPISTTNHPNEGMTNDKEIVDLNGDSLPDLIWGKSTAYKIYLNNGSNDFQAPFTASNYPPIDLSDPKVRLMDLNGDSLPDLLKSTEGGGSSYSIYYNNGSGNFQAPVTAVNPPTYGTDDPDIRYADFNGDGLLDIIYGASCPYKIWINNGVNGFLPVRTVTNCPSHSLTHQNLAQLVDMNSDGLTDLLVSTTANPPVYKIYFNNGQVDFNAPITAENPPVLSTSNFNVRLSDLNGDGLMDIILGDITQSGVPYQICFNNGRTGFRPPAIISNYPNADLDDPNNLLVDFNGDGLLDLLRGAPVEGAYRVYRSVWAGGSSSRDSILISMTNGIGGQTDILYQNLPIFGLQPLQYKWAHTPVMFNSIQSLIRKNAFGENYKTDYILQDGLWDAGEREFRGFGTAKVKDALGNFSITKILQDDTFKGRPLQQESYDKNGKLFSKVVNIWNEVPLTGGSKFVFLKKMDSFAYNGDATGKRTQEEYFYDESVQPGNLTKTIQYGEVDLNTGADTGADRRTVEVQYLNNISGGSWFVGFPKYTLVKDHSGAVVKQSWFYYDGSSDFNQLPTKGQLTKKKGWAGNAPGAISPETKYTYDVFGNLKTTQDTNNNTTTMDYDTAYQMFPFMTQNAKGHQVVNEYYGVNGVSLDSGDGFKGLWGQLKSTTDPNQQKGRRVYDIFGRVVATVSPLDSISLPTATTQYDLTNQYVKLTTSQREKTGGVATMDAVQFLDGLGRLIQTKSKAETAGQFIVSGQTEYDTRGLPIKKYLSYFTSISMNSINPIDPNKPHSIITYDDMGRMIKTQNPDGTYVTVIYDDWKTTTIDENGHQQVAYVDAYGRLIKKEEYSGADGRNSFYPSAPFTLYATTLYTYDSEGNLKSVQDAQGNITTINYDNLDRKVSMNDADMGVWQYDYDSNGNLISQLDQKNQQLDFVYDQVNRLTQKTLPALPAVNYTYDDTLVNFSKGRLTKAQYNTNADTQFKYDAIGRETESTKKIDGANYQVARSYDDLNRLVLLTYPVGGNVTYTYNATGQIETVSGNFSSAPPPPPMAPTLNNPVPGNGQVSLSWSIVSGVTGYKLEYKPTSSGTWSLAYDGTNTNYTKTGLTNGTSYDFRVFAYNQGGMSSASTIKSATPTAAPAQITIDTSTNVTAINKTSQTLSHTVNNTGTNRALVVTITLADFSVVPQSNSVTYAGQAMTLINRQSKVSGGDDATVEMWYLLNPPTGANTVQANFNTSVDDLTIGGISLKGVKQQAPEAVVKSSGVSTTASVSLNTTTANAWILDALFYGTSTTWVNIGSGQTQRYKTLSSGDTHAASYKFDRPVGSTTMQWTLSSSGDDWALVAAAFAPASSSAALHEEKENPITYARTQLLQLFVDLFGVREAEASQQLDYTTFTETDPTSQITKTTDCVSFNNLETNVTTAYVYKSYTEAGDFNYTFDALISAADTFAGPLLIWGVSANAGAAFDDWTDGVYLTYYKAGGIFRVEMGGPGIATALSSSFVFGQRYYFTLTRTGNTVTAKVYSNAGRTNLLSTLNVTETTQSFGYMYGLSTRTFIGSNYKMTGDVCHLVDETAGPSVPAAPVLNNPVPGDGQVSLSWSSVSGATGYKLEYKLTYSGTWSLAYDGTNINYPKTGLTNGTSYDFRAFAYNGQGTSNASAVKSATPQVSAPSAPVLNTPTAGNGVVNLSWSAVSGATSYKVKYGTSSGSYGTIQPVGNQTSYQVPGLTNGTTYYFVVSAVNAGGAESLNSNQVSSIPQTQTSDQITFISNVDYNAAGQITKVVLGNGNVTTYTYNPLNLRLTTIKTTNAQNQNIQNLSYIYDGVGNIMSITDSVNTATQNFQYDALNRLTSANGNYGNKIYAYDTIGNILQKDGVNYLYGENGAGPHAVTSGSDGSSFNYDANGNMITMNKGGVAWTYIYDSENRLVEVKKNSQTQAKFEYDGDGGRTKKVSYTYVSGTPVTETTRYVGSLYEESASQTTKHIFMGDTRIASITNGQLKYYHGDHLGGTNLITNDSGLVKQLIEYEPFGTPSRNDKFGTPEEEAWHLFTGKELDDETGLYYYGARYYNPTIGRFITADTIVQSPGNPQTLNRYAYAGNNPVNNIDPTGHSWFGKFVKTLVGGVIGGVVGALSGQPWLGFSAYNAFAAAMDGGNIGAAIAGAVTGYFGGGFIGGMAGNFWGTIAAGALGGAAGSAIAGGDIGLAALSGFAGGFAGYGVGAITGFAGLGTIIGGGVASEVAGGDFADGALGGLAYNVGFSVGSSFASIPELAETASVQQSGDTLFYAGERNWPWYHPLNLAQAIFDPGPFNHTDIGLGGGMVAGSHPGMGVSNDGPDVRNMKDFPAYQRERVIRIKGNSKVGKYAGQLALDLKDQSVGFNYLNSKAIFSNNGNSYFCSQFTAKAYKEAGQSGVYGVGPNTQYWFLK